MVGFLLQWPTSPTTLMFPVLAFVYARLARKEERDVAQAFGPVWQEYSGAVHPSCPATRSEDTDSS